MNTCKTCKWWGEEFQSWPITDHRKCMSEKLFGISMGRDSDGLNDNADYDYGISTGPNFGCIHWAERMQPSKETKDAS